MNNYGNIALNNIPRSSNLSAINSKVPVSATANSRIKLSTGDFDIHETIISTEVTASNPSIAAARATAKAASIATSALTVDNQYISQHDLENNFTFQISTFCTIKQIKPESVDKNQPFLNMESTSSKNGKHYNKSLSSFQRGTKFEKIRKELESFEQDDDYQKNNYLNDYHVDSLNKSGRLSAFSTLSNMSTCSSIKSEPVTYHSFLSEPLTNSFDNANTTSYEYVRKKYNIHKNAFLNSDLDSSDSNSNSKKFKISDLKRSDKIQHSETKLRDIKGLSSSQKDIHSLYHIETTPGTSYAKSFTLNRNIETLFSTSSSMLETDLDSATLNTGLLFPQTDFYGNQPSFSFEKTRSMIDIRKNSDTLYEEKLRRALSTENLKKSKPVEEIGLITRLKSKAQSTQELRIADSLTKLNVPEWMQNFKINDRNIQTLKPQERKSLGLHGESSTLKFKDVKRHDNILSKYKYDSLSMSKHNMKTKEQINPINQTILPSSLYRSKSQNLLYFNPKEHSKLKGAMQNLSSSLKSLNTSKINTTKILEPIYDSNVENIIKCVENKSAETKIESLVTHSDYKMKEKKIENPIKLLELKLNEWKKEISLNYSELENKNKKAEKESNECQLKNVIKSKETELNSDISLQCLELSEVKLESPIERISTFPNENEVVLSQHAVLLLEGSKEDTFRNFEEKDNIIMQSKKESQLFLQKIIDSTLNPYLVIDDICEAFRINPTTLKLLLNVKRKTPNLNRDETFANMKVNENSYVENILRKNDKNKHVIFCDFKKCKNELFQTNKVSRTTCSCYNCYTYYCSKKCRNMGFTNHFHACSFKRIREMLLKIKSQINEQQIEALAKFSVISYKSFGRGIMTIAFESCRAADDFLNKQPNRLMSQPYYLKLSELVDINAKDFIDYNPEKEFVICLIISATLPMTNVEFSYPTFKYCYNVMFPVKFQLSNTITEKIKIKNELKLESPERRKEQSNAKVKFYESAKVLEEKNEYEIRKQFFNYVISYFDKKNINLIQNYSSIYKKLENFLSEGILFQPLTIYIKDPLLNSTVCCTIIPSKEITLKPVRTATKSYKSFEIEPKQNGNKILAETEI